MPEFEQRAELRSQLYAFYMEHREYINNWDLVDTSAPTIVGRYSTEFPKDKRQTLSRLAKSRTVWDRQIGMLATNRLIRAGAFRDALFVAKLLVRDPHDLIQKAVGWMLREIGTRDPSVEERLLDDYAPSMPRTMLRYAIQKLPAKRRQHYLSLERKPR